MKHLKFYEFCITNIIFRFKKKKKKLELSKVFLNLFKNYKIFNYDF